MPNSDLGRQALEETRSCGFNWQITAFTFCAFIAFARFKPCHQLDGSAKGQGNLLVTATNSQCRLRSLFYHLNHPGQLLRRVSVPWMTLATQNNMRRTKCLNALERHSVVGLDQYFQPLA